MDKEPKLEGRYVNMMALPKTNTLLKIKEDFNPLFSHKTKKFNLLNLNKAKFQVKSKTFFIKIMKMQIYKEDSSMPKMKSVSGALKDLK